MQIFEAFTILLYYKYNCSRQIKWNIWKVLPCFVWNFYWIQYVYRSWSYQLKNSLFLTEWEPPESTLCRYPWNTTGIPPDVAKRSVVWPDKLRTSYPPHGQVRQDLFDFAYFLKERSASNEKNQSCLLDVSPSGWTQLKFLGNPVKS